MARPVGSRSRPLNIKARALRVAKFKGAGLPVSRPNRLDRFLSGLSDADLAKIIAGIA